jgi:hypothetical protein
MFSKKPITAAIGIAVALFAAATTAKATTLDFSYTLTTGSVLSGTLDGTLLSGGNDFDVTSVSSLFVNGAAVALPTGVFSTDSEYGFGGAAPTEVSLDGSYMNLYASDSSDAFAFAAGDQLATHYGYPLAGATVGYGGLDLLVDYSSADWSASVASPVPEPSSFVLMLMPMTLLAFLWMRRREGLANSFATRT